MFSTWMISANVPAFASLKEPEITGCSVPTAILVRLGPIVTAMA